MFILLFYYYLGKFFIISSYYYSGKFLTCFDLHILYVQYYFISYIIKYNICYYSITIRGILVLFLDYYSDNVGIS